MTTPQSLGEIEKLRCGCEVPVSEKRHRIWFYRPELSEPSYWFRPVSPIWLGGDEFCRRTLVIGWNVTGQVVIPFRYCRGCADCRDYPSKADRFLPLTDDLGDGR